MKLSNLSDVSRNLVLSALASCVGVAFAADPGKILIQADKPGARIDPMFYGIMTEEINFSYEGGLYGELIQNRIFRNPANGGGQAVRVTGTNDPILFMTEHYGMESFSCKAPNGKYIAKLYFAETYGGITGTGQRVFSMNVQGQDVSDFDIWAKAGGPNKAYIETVAVEVTNGEFVITFTPKIENPAINAIELLPETEGAAAIRIDAGRANQPLTDSSNHVWQPDSGFTGMSDGVVDHGPVQAETESTSGAISGAAHWSLLAAKGAVGQASLDTTNPINDVALTTSLRLTVTELPQGSRIAVANDGYWGIPVKPNWTYTNSFYAKGSDGFTGPLTISIESNDGKTTYASATIPAITNEWKLYKTTLKAGNVMPTADTLYVISAGSKGTVNLNQVSLFPPVYKQRTGAALGQRPATGFRADIMKLLVDMKPAYLRFPGGNYVEGFNFANRFNWKEMIGPWEQRPGHQSPWGYRSSDGLGLLEFLEWCEEMGAEPVVGVYAGLHLDGGRDIRTGEALKPFVQEALEEIEYITGGVDTKWGAQRAKDGHPAPFKLTYVEVGNEDWLNNGTASYGGPEGRYAMFYNAIKAKYPQLKVIATVDPKVPHDMIDNHHYMSPAAAIRNAHVYDNTDRNGPKIFEGEWASQETGTARGLTPSMQCALSDGAFLTGLERNADMIIMNCYAPLFTRMDQGGNQWKTNLIGYDSLGSFGSPAYYTQVMFANAKGDVVLPVVSVIPQTVAAPAVAPEQPAAPGARPGRGRPEAGPNPAEPLFVSSSKEDSTGDIIVKVVNIFPAEQNMTVELAGVTVKSQATGQVMSADPAAVNSVENPLNVAPKDFTITNASSSWNHTFPGNSVTVIRFKTK